MLYDKMQRHPQLTRQSFRYGIMAIVLILLGFFKLDQAIAYFFKLPALEAYYAFNREITNVGYSIHYFVMAIIGLLVSRYFYKRISFLKNNPAANKALGVWSLFVIKCLVIIGVVTNIFKFIIGRQRPHSTEDFQNLNFVPLSTHSHWHSFPSGHTQVMFTIATIASLIFPKYTKAWLSLAFYLGFTRVVIHQHFFSDFIGGAFLGCIGVLWIYHLWPPKFE